MKWDGKNFIEDHDKYKQYNQNHSLVGGRIEFENEMDFARKMDIIQSILNWHEHKNIDELFGKYSNNKTIEDYNNENDKTFNDYVKEYDDLKNYYGCFFEILLKNEELRKKPEYLFINSFFKRHEN